MDGIGNEIGQKMRSAIKAKLTELGCYVDDELPDYVMVMVANKRTRAQMEDDLQLFLGDNTEMFVNWLHQVLKKLQEVSVTPPLITDLEKKKERSASKERKEKKGKTKSKKSESSKKSKKKDKEKAHKKEEKKSNKRKKKSKHEMIRPNIPPLLMNIEKESEPSITDVFAGQILKNHGITLDSYNDDLKEVETKVIEANVVETKVIVVDEVQPPVVPIVDPATISSQSEEVIVTETVDTPNINPPTPSVSGDNIQEMNKIEAKIQGLRQKLVEQLDSMSDDDDFLNIRTEAEELMNDFAEDVLQEISQPPPVTPPLQSNKTLFPIQKPIVESQKPKDTPQLPETLPQIELNLPKRPIRERLGERDVQAVNEVKENESTKKAESPERFTPEKEIEFRPKARSSKNRLGSQSESHKKSTVSEETHEKESSSKRLTSKVSATCASVVRVRPRVRVGAPASSLLLRAVADAHKSLLNIPPKVDHGSQKVKRAMVLPMRRCDAQKIVIQVPGGPQSSSHTSSADMDSEMDAKKSKNKKKNDFAPNSITKVINNSEYKGNRTSYQQDNFVDTITIHNTTADKDKRTQFIVTMDGYHPNAFLAKKLLTEGIVDDTVGQETLKETIKTEPNEEQIETKEISNENPESDKELITSVIRKRLSNTSEESDTQVIIKQEQDIIESSKNTDDADSINHSPPTKKRKASPIIFDVDKKEKEKYRVRERSISASSDSHVTLTSSTNTNKYDDLPPLSAAGRAAAWCRLFPQCRFGAACVFLHPRCKFAAACTRRACAYSHAPAAPSAPLLASHVVPAANYKSISAVVPPSMCKFYPNCVNPTCHFYHPKPCRFGKACTNKLECNFFHNDVPSKWKYSV